MIQDKFKNKENSLEILSSLDHFFCISHFNGDISWVQNIKKGNYIIYNKSGMNIDHITNNYISIKMYNAILISSNYFRFIVS